MKLKKLQKKLSLNQKTVVNLSGNEMNNARGGATNAGCPWTYPPCDTFMNSCLPCYQVPTDVFPYC